ncbi:MAG: hypothetical protein CVV27_13050 [Candidatus Melainabacteria bacterium HGW-Melainabacteria-1]|nr:MAG: hypothetical protein CVV27_13050 [Candidatus Melainabacteria bacterium HGW-Melainabacteria-1]
MSVFDHPRLRAQTETLDTSLQAPLVPTHEKLSRQRPSNGLSAVAQRPEGLLITLEDRIQECCFLVLALTEDALCPLSSCELARLEASLRGLQQNQLDYADELARSQAPTLERAKLWRQLGELETLIRGLRQTLAAALPRTLISRAGMAC